MGKPANPKPVTVRFTKRCYERVRSCLFKDEFEAMCFVFCHVGENAKRRLFLADYCVELDDSCYLKRSRTSVVINHRAKNLVYSRFVASSFTGFLNVHSHPFEQGHVRFSHTDDEDDLGEMLWQWQEFPRGKKALGNPSKIHCLSMVFGQKSIAARGFQPGSPATLPTIEQVQVLGEKFEVIYPTGAGNTRALTSSELQTYDRQISAFGKHGQHALANLKVALIGVGGIGSVLAEGLLRLGVRILTLIDHDVVSPHSLNRMQGGRPKDVGRLKAHVLARRLRTMKPQMKVCSIGFPLTHPRALRAIKGVDVLIGAVDNHIARFLLTRLSVQYLIPYLDAATVIKKGGKENNNQMDLLFRLGVVVPGITACLDCSQITYYDKKEIVLHLYDAQTRAQLEASGYIQDHPEIAAPAVMPLNMLAASAVLIELLNLVAAFHPLARSVAIDWLHPDHRTLRADSSNFPEGPATDCLTCCGFLGAGDSEPLPAVDMAPSSEPQTANHFPPCRQ